MKIDNNDSYEYMRLTHTLAICWGLPITRRPITDKSRHDSDSDVQGHRYTFDRRVVPVWSAYAALYAFIAYYNYLEATGYVGESFKKCFEESYCFAVNELVNRNVGPLATLVCVMFHGRRHKVAALAGTERIIGFLRDTDALDRRLPGTMLRPAARFYSAAVIVAYTACIWLYAAAVPAAVVALYCVNSMGQTAVYAMVTFQYYVLERGYARVNRLLEATDVRRDPKSSLRSLCRLADAHGDLSRLTEHLNQAYALALLFKWPYTIVRVMMVVFRIFEMSPAMSVDRPQSNVAAVLLLEHVLEILLSLLQLSCFCITGTRLSHQVNIFWIQVSARTVNATIGGFIIINMNFLKAMCGIITTYILVLVQFQQKKGNSKPLHHIWN